MSSTKLKNEYNYIPISILVPAYNEGVTIVDTIYSLMELDYPNYEICIINDGSIDDTAQVVIDTFGLKEVRRPIRRVLKCEDAVSIYENQKNIKITLVNKNNGGKSDALNMGINVSRFPLFVTIDADSVLQKDALRKIAEPFLESDETICAGGNINISNGVTLDKGKVVKVELPKKLLVKFQLIEYFRVFLTSRVAFNTLNANLIVSGAFGIFRKKAVINVGGYTNNTIGEDMELVVKLHAFYHKNNLKYRISYVPDAVCWTQAPENFKTLKNQRIRWFIGMGQSLKVSRFMLFNPSYGTVGFIGYPYFLFFEYIAPLLEILGVTTIIASFILRIIDVRFFITYLIVYMGFSLIVTIISVLLQRKLFNNFMNTKMFCYTLLVCVLESFGYRQIVSIIRFGSFFRKNKNSWGAMIRTRNKNVDQQIIQQV